MTAELGIGHQRVVYFDTSAINYFFDRLTVADATETRIRQQSKGIRWAISPVVIWELLRTTDEARREALIYFSKHLFSSQLLPSPEEMLVNYIQQGCPLEEPFRDLVSSSELASTWRDICRDEWRTFLFDSSDLARRFALLAPMTRDLHRITRHRRFLVERYAPDVVMDAFLEATINAIPFRENGRVWLSQQQRQIFKISAFYVLLILCAETGVDPIPVKRFWRRTGISCTRERFAHLIEKHPALFHRGPVLCMAHMTLTQFRTKFSRGVYWDSLHAAYLPYVSQILSEDSDFIGLRDALAGRIDSLRICRPSEMEITFHDTRLI